MSKSRSNVPVTIFFLCGSVPGKFWLRQFHFLRYASFYLVFIPIERFFYIYWSREATTTLLKLVNGIIFYFLFFSYCCALINKALARKKRNIFVLDIIVNFNLNINTILDRINLSQIIL